MRRALANAGLTILETLWKAWRAFALLAIVAIGLVSIRGLFVDGTEWLTGVIAAVALGYWWSHPE